MPGAGPVLLVVHHNVSPATDELLEAALAGIRQEGLESVRVRAVAALAATAGDVLGADGFLLGTPVNIGYMSGALKVFFDNVYYPCRHEKTGAPYGLWVHGNSDATGAIRAVESIAGAMGWRSVGRPVTVVGAPTRADREEIGQLAATVAAHLVTE